MQISLLKTWVDRVLLSRDFEELEDGQKVIEQFLFKPAEIEGDSKQFAITFDMVINTRDGAHIELEFNALFATSDDVDEEFMDSHFVTVNAPAIAYPFLRSFVSTTLLQAGYDPLMLPAVNFTRAKPTD